MNPHFINNALQWVQNRVFHDKEAVTVVGKLAENIKIVFKNTREKKSFHSLKNEVNLVQNYLLIQKFRFGDRLEYSLPHSEIINSWGDRLMLPLMIIQIHCENAIEHGINNTEEGGQVSIHLRDEENHIIINIEDNGIGRIKAQEIGSSGTQQGTKMLKELIEIYNLNNTYKLSQKYEDGIFSTSSGEKYGTRVILQIPKKYNYDLG